MENDISVKKAILATAISKYSSVVIQVVFTMILSRILTPSEFGVVAVVTIFLAFFSLLSDMGLGVGVIQNKNLSSKDICDIFTVSIYIGIILAVLFSFLGYPISIFYNDEIYTNLCPLLALTIVFNSCNMIPGAVMLKHKMFKSIAYRTVVCNIASSSITIVLSLNGWGVYALCLNQVLGSFFIFVWNELTVKLNFSFRPNLNPLKQIFGYSFFHLSAQTVNFFSRNMDNLIIGKIFSKADLAYYNKSYTLMMMPISYIPGVINPVLHPILSEYQDDKDEILKRFLKLVQFLLNLGFPLSISCVLFGNEIIYILFGSQWDNAVLPFKLLSISLFGQLLTNVIGNIYLSMGETRLLFKSVIVSTSLILSCIVIGSLMGNINSVALMVAIAYSINYFITYYILISVAFNSSFVSFLKRNIRDYLLYYIYIIAIFIIPTCSQYLLGLLIRVAFFLLFLFLYFVFFNHYTELKKSLQK